MSNKRNGTLYVGVTSNLPKRVYEHKMSLTKGFTSRYNLTELVYFEMHTSMEEAIVREKRLKKWNRAWKISLIESINPLWNDLYDEVIKG